MSNNKKFNREEISRILKIASELDQHEELEEEGLTHEELRNVAREVGIDAKHIETAIHQLQNHHFEESSPNFIEENFAYRKSNMVEGIIDDSLWEEIVTEIRRINGGIGKTSKLGSTYEWEQRKKNTGYLQVSVTPKNDHSRLRISASYKNFSNFLGLLGGLVGFTTFAVLADGLSLEMLIAGIGAFAGWGASRIYLKAWMQRKRKMLRSLSNRLTKVLSQQKEPTPVGDSDKSRPEIKLDEQSQENRDSGQARKRLPNQ